MEEGKKFSACAFIGFKEKKDLAEYYAAADLFTILSRGDVWGLVVNEAMTYGLPIISSNLCIAGTELVKDGENGFVVDLEDFETLKKLFSELISDDTRLKAYGKSSYLKIAKHTFTQMVEYHNIILYR